MDLDAHTLTFLGGLIAAASGVFLLVHWAPNRSASPAALWGSANIFMGCGVFLLALAPTLPPIVAAAAAPLLLNVASILTWLAARGFRTDAGILRPVALVIGSWIVAELCAMVVFGQHSVRAVGVLVGGSLYVAAAIELWRWPAEGLRARTPLVLLLGLQAASLVVTAVAVGMADGPGFVTTVGWLGLIHFVAPVYAAGSAVYVVALLKEQSERRLHDAAAIDALTNLLNRRTFLERAERLHRRMAEEDKPVSLLALDLDHFKRINDAYGHAMGDEVLIEFAAVVVRALRPTDLAGRIGGEEFAAIVPGGREVAAAIARRIRDGFGKHGRVVGGYPVNATVSIGVASTQMLCALPDLMVSADRALYRAKDMGRNRVALEEGDGCSSDAGNIIRVA